MERKRESSEKFSFALEGPFHSLQCKTRDCVAILNDPCLGLHWVDHVESSIRSLVEGGNCTGHGHWSEDEANLRSGIVCLFVCLFLRWKVGGERSKEKKEGPPGPKTK